MAETAVIHFDDAVISAFKPLADHAGLNFRQVRSDCYQIAGSGFILRMRRGAGHFKDVLVTLAPSALAGKNIDDLSGEIGLGNVAEYHNVAVPEQDLSSVASFYSSLSRVAEITEAVCMPYLKGQKGDYAEIRAFVDRKIEGTEREWGPWPPNVREEWLD